jgi:hypothetical protein
MKIPPELDRITDVVLAYHPKPKSKRAKMRARRIRHLQSSDDSRVSCRSS